MKSCEFQQKGEELKLALADTSSKFGLEVIREELDVYGVVLLYQNQIAGVRCSFSPKEGGGWTVIVGRLTDGSFPAHPIQVDELTRLDRFNVRDLAAVQPDRIPKRMKQKLEQNHELTAVDANQLLKSCCYDILTGNFSTFEDASVIVKNRAKLLAKDYPRNHRE